MKKYRSKYGLELIGFLLAVFAFNLFVARDEIIEMLACLSGVSAIIFYILISISYTVDEKTLTVNNAFWQKTKIDIATIRKITETNNPLSSPAGSLDRLEISYGNQFDSVLISPVNREEFIKYLLSVNPSIKVKLKEKPTLFSKLAV